MSEPLLDPQLEAFYAQDPAHFLERGPLAEPLDPSTPPHARVAIELAVAFLVVRGLVAKHLAGQDPRLGEVPVVAGQAWRHYAPIWLRFAVPAIRQAYALGEVEGLSDSELEEMATEYAQGLGEYLDGSSAEALLAGFTQQLNGRWNEQLAWQRAAAAYGLDKQQMRSYVGALMDPGEVPGVDPVPVAARLMADKLLTLRAQTMGETEGWRAGQSGKAIAWMIRQQRGELPADALREWDNRNEQACKTCRALHGQRVSLTEPFIHPVTGEQLWAPGAHPHCKCELALVLWRPKLAELGKVAALGAGLCLRAADTGRILMLQRAHDPRDPVGGLWEFPGGKPEPGEAAEAAAVREWEEECRRRLPRGARPDGEWQAGRYLGFVRTIGHEAEVPVHRRGRVVNPDDPDGDAVEALAWWEPAHLSDNPAVRPELAHSLPAVHAALSGLSKRLGEDPYDRDKKGRFAATEHRAGRRTTYKEPIRDPVVEEILRQVKEGHEAFGVPSHARDLFASPFAGPPRDLFATPRDLFRRPRDPFGVERGPARSLFDQRKRLGSIKDRSQLKRVIHHVAVPLPQPGEPKQRNHEPYYLPAEELASAYEEINGDVLWGPGDGLDFSDANENLRNYSNYFDSSDGEPMSIYAVRTDHPMGLLEREQPWFPQAVVDQRWSELLPALRHAHQQAIAHADDLVERLSERELRHIFAMAGYDTREEPAVMRARIVRAVHGRDGGDDSLAGAYVDHIAWTEPELLGDQGVELSRMINDEIDAEIIVFGAEHNQFFAFENGFHDGSEHHSLGHVVDLHSDYVASHATYHSALMEKGSGAEPFVVGWREISMVPADAHGKPLPRE